MDKVVFLDRDGTISKDSPDHIKSWDEVHFLPNTKEGIKLLNDNGFNIIIITNQSVIARGMVTKEGLDFIHQKMIEELEEYGCKIHGIYYCPHHPDDECNCRKPNPGLLLKAALENDIDTSKSYMVGDRMMDVEAGKVVSCKTILIPSELGLQELKNSLVKPDYVAKDLLDAGKWILNNYRDH
ncbi:MAG: D-glycero-beta-D-manno-heptose 1,7-bisphosphate 7-phosphatase [Thermoplasmatales archaeon]|nr:MAG: D-glycero-beta-D-manno-heptose 1,7-bisphosphate 7-phosphatase [Thermoplasmatales archaeon]